MSSSVGSLFEQAEKNILQQRSGRTDVGVAEIAAIKLFKDPDTRMSVISIEHAAYAS